MIWVDGFPDNNLLKYKIDFYGSSLIKWSDLIGFRPHVSSWQQTSRLYVLQWLEAFLCAFPLLCANFTYNFIRLTVSNLRFSAPESFKPGKHVGLVLSTSTMHPKFGNCSWKGVFLHSNWHRWLSVRRPFNNQRCPFVMMHPCQTHYSNYVPKHVSQ